jgi:uncharacterized protein YbaR (Trm112 family)
MDKKLLSILACPLCKGPVLWRPELNEIWCRADGLAFKVEDDIPVMLVDQARHLTVDEKLAKK